MRSPTISLKPDTSADDSLGGDLRCQRRVRFGRLKPATSLVRLASIAKRY